MDGCIFVAVRGIGTECSDSLQTRHNSIVVSEATKTSLYNISLSNRVTLRGQLMTMTICRNAYCLHSALMRPLAKPKDMQFLSSAWLLKFKYCKTSGLPANLHVFPAIFCIYSVVFFFLGKTFIFIL